MKKIGFALMSGLLLVAGAGAAKNDNNPQHLDPFVNGPTDEPKLIQEVRHKLMSLPYYGVFDDLGFTVNGTTVTLLGEVTQPVLKIDADKSAKEVEGVTDVVNNIEVLPVSAMDDRIRRAVFRAIYGDPQLSTRYGYEAVPSIHIIVKNGDVRLEGVVADQFDRNLCFIRANAVPGVFKVENDLRISKKS